MARGLIQAIAARTRASDTAGSRSRISRASGTPNFSAGLAERGIDHLLLGQSAPGQIGDNCAIALDIDVIAMRQFLGLGGVPEKSATGLRFAADQIIGLLPRGDVATARGIVQQDDAGVRSKSAREQR